jgi:uncharacterized protein YbjQ (UPF0145 family)
MANCELCGKSIAFMGGGKEPYTGKELYVCNECGLVFKKLDVAMKEGHIEQFRENNDRLLNLAKGRDAEKVIVEFSNTLERMTFDKKRQIVEEAQIEAYKKIVSQKYGQLRASFLSTTGYDFEGYHIKKYLGVVNGQAVLGTGFLSEVFASASDTFGTESNSFSKKIREAKKLAFEDMLKEALYKGANAMIGIDIDIMTIGNNMIAVSANGTAVTIEKI